MRIKIGKWSIMPMILTALLFFSIYYPPIIRINTIHVLAAISYIYIFTHSTAYRLFRIIIRKVLQELDNKTGFQWMCLMRAHPSSPGLKNLESTHAIIDVSKYPDMTDILAVSDMLITDYSSSVCDFALTTKPTVMAAYDIEEYIKKYRGFKVRPDEVGFFVAKTQEDLIRIIKEKTEEDYIAAYNKVNEFFGTNETGKATETICSVIDSWYNNKIENR